MSISDVVPILDSILGPHRQFAKGEHYYYCPFCHHHNPKLAININTGYWHCWKCDLGGRSVFSLVKRLDVPVSVRRELAGMLSHDIATHKPEEQPVVTLRLPTEFVPLADATPMFSTRRVLNYLAVRGVRPVDITRYNIGYCSTGLYANRIIIPSYDDTGQLNYFVARDYTDSAVTKYRNPPVSKNVVGFDSQINWQHPVTLVEGMFDAIATRWNAVPLIGSTISSKLREKLLITRAPVILALDEDALKKSLRIANMLLKEGIAVKYVHIAGKDPADMGFAAMRSLIQQAEPMDFMHLMSLKLSLL